MRDFFKHVLPVMAKVREVILDIKLSESGEGSKERDHGK